MIENNHCQSQDKNTDRRVTNCIRLPHIAETLEMLDKELFRKGKDDEVIDAYVEVYNRIIPDSQKVI